MRLIFFFIVLGAVLSCNVSANKIPAIPQSSMPRPWQKIAFEEEFLPHKGYPFEPVFITNDSELSALLKWQGIDTGYKELFNLKKENVIASFRPESKGKHRYSLWLHKNSNTLSIKKEMVMAADNEAFITPAYLYFYRIPKSGTKLKILEQ
jgi:hypothetical protein